MVQIDNKKEASSKVRIIFKGIPASEFHFRLYPIYAAITESQLF